MAHAIRKTPEEIRKINEQKQRRIMLERKCRRNEFIAQILFLLVFAPIISIAAVLLWDSLSIINYLKFSIINTILAFIGIVIFTIGNELKERKIYSRHFKIKWYDPFLNIFGIFFVGFTSSLISWGVYALLGLIKKISDYQLYITLGITFICVLITYISLYTRFDIWGKIGNILDGAYVGNEKQLKEDHNNFVRHQEELARRSEQEFRDFVDHNH